MEFMEWLLSAIDITVGKGFTVADDVQGCGQSPKRK